MRARVVTAIAVSAIGWGGGAVGVRVAFEADVPTFTVIDVRLITAALAVVFYMAVRARRTGIDVWRHGALIGIPRIGLAPVLFISSLQFISAGVEGLFITLIPVVTSAMAWLMIDEPLNRTQLGGLLLGLLGAGLIVLSGESGLGPGEGSILAGGALAMGGVIAGAVSGVLSRKYAPLHDTADLAMPMFVTGTALALALSFVVANGPDVEMLDGPLWALLIALGLGSTLLPFVGTLYAARYTTATRVAIVGYAAPVTAVIGGIAILDEVITPGIIAGGVLALSGALLVGLGRVRPRVAANLSTGS